MLLSKAAVCSCLGCIGLVSVNYSVPVNIVSNEHIRFNLKIDGPKLMLNIKLLSNFVGFLAHTPSL